MALLAALRTAAMRAPTITGTTSSVVTGGRWWPAPQAVTAPLRKPRTGGMSGNGRARSRYARTPPPGGGARGGARPRGAGGAGRRGGEGNRRAPVALPPLGGAGARARGPPRRGVGQGEQHRRDLGRGDVGAGGPRQQRQQ